MCKQSPHLSAKCKRLARREQQLRRSPKPIKGRAASVSATVNKQHPCKLPMCSEVCDSLNSLNMEDTSINSPVLLMTIPPTDSRSISPLTPSPSRELRGVRLFRAISRKLARRSVDDLSYTCEEDSRSSSTDSCSSTSASARCSRSKKLQNGSSCSSGGSGFRSVSPNHISSSGSDTSSESHNNTVSKYRHHSTTGTSFRKVFQSLSISNSRSQSCSSSSKEGKKKSSKKSTPKRILRPPVTYTYVRGLSGLPTQRVPRSSARIYTGQTGCGCVSNGSYVPGLHR